MGNGHRLGEFEHLVLVAIHQLRGKAYGMTIRREIADRTGRDVSIGAVYTTLDRLERKGFVRSWRGDPTPERGGRAKRYFKIDAPGVRALNQSVETRTRMWAGLVPNEV